MVSFFFLSFNKEDIITRATDEILNFTTQRNSVRTDYSQNITHYEVCRNQ